MQPSIYAGMRRKSSAFETCENNGGTALDTFRLRPPEHDGTSLKVTEVLWFLASHTLVSLSASRRCLAGEVEDCSGQAAATLRLRSV